MFERTVSGITLTLLLIGMLTLAFNIQPVEASGTIYIRADGSVEPSTANITSMDNGTYTFISNIYDSIVVERINIIVNGNGYTLQGIGSGKGFYLSGVKNVTIKNTHIKGFKYSIYFSSSSYSVISGNKITANIHYGICLWRSSDNSLSGNKKTNNDGGIWLGSSSNNIIAGNNITANKHEGICLMNSDSSNNSITGNNVTNSDRGILLYDCSNNIIHHNNFINNADQIFYTGNPVNIWDNGYPSGGNYWSDYTGNDAYSGPYQNETGSDGIGDASYVIDENNTDRYPLMHPWSPPTIRAAVLDSWGADVYDGTIYPWLNNEWSRYGLASIEIDYTSLNKEGISYSDIVLTKANVLIISHAYSGWDFTDSEITAIRRYVEEGHGLIGTYGTLIPENNRKLAELFGMNVSTNYGYPILSSGIFNILDVAHPLFASLPNPFIAPTVSETIYVPSHDWMSEGVTDGTILALTTDNEAAIIARSATYRSVYFTNQMEEKEVGMPETSIQVFYNAIVWAASPPQAYSLTITTMVGGTTNPAPGTYSYVANSTVQVTAIPDPNFLFHHWELNDVDVGSANPYVVGMDKDHTLKAIFSPVPAIPVGGYSIPIKGCTAEKPLTLYFALIAILVASFTTIRRKIHKRIK